MLEAEKVIKALKALLLTIDPAPTEDWMEFKVRVRLKDGNLDAYSPTLEYSNPELATAYAYYVGKNVSVNGGFAVPANAGFLVDRWKPKT